MRRWSPAFFSSPLWQELKQWGQTEAEFVPSEHKETLFHSDRALPEVTQRSHGVSFLGDIEKPSRHVPEQTALGNTTHARELTKWTFRGPFTP